jgi:hypothetical protein
MKTVITLLAAAALIAPSLAAPQIALAQPAGDYGRDYGRGDVCRREKAESGTRGAFLGGLLGGIFGSAVAGRGNRVAGAVIGGTAGAAIGNAAGRHSVECVQYPARIGYHEGNCRWVTENYDGERHEFEICRGPDGVWRPSGRA